MKAVQNGDITGILTLTTSIAEAMDTQFNEDQAALKQNLTDAEKNSIEDQGQTRSQVSPSLKYNIQ